MVQESGGGIPAIGCDTNPFQSAHNGWAMRTFFPVIAGGCLLHAFAATLCQYLLVFLYDAATSRTTPFVIYSILVISWPLWGLVLWKSAMIGLRAKSATTAFFGLVLFSPVIVLAAHFYTGHEISDNFFLR